jgi:hypothetical protein
LLCWREKTFTERLSEKQLSAFSTSVENVVWCSQNVVDMIAASTSFRVLEGSGGRPIHMKMVYKFLIGLIIVAIIVVGGRYFFTKGQQDFVIRPGEKLSEEQVTRLVARVGRFLVLPTGEKPSVAAISDVASLATTQAFYQDAKDGDILLVYSNKAIIYDAVADKLVNVGPIVRTDQRPGENAQASPSATPEPVDPETIEIEVRNGTTIAGLAGAMASDLKDNELFNVQKVGDAAGSYTETIIVDLTDTDGKAAAVRELAYEIGAEVVSELPDGEREAKYEVLVLIGK